MSDGWSREKILELSAAFCRSRILLTAAELDLFGKLSKTPRTVGDLCNAEGWDPRGLTILLDALAALGLVSKSPDARYGLDPEMTSMLTGDGRRTLLPMLLHRVHLWQSWSHLTKIVKTGKAPGQAGTNSRSDEEIHAFIEAMNVVAGFMADMIVDSIDLTRYQRLLDVGGGPGAYTMAFLRRAPHMTATLFDLPRVTEMARNHLRKEGLIDRVQIVEGDYTTDELPTGHDLALLSAIIHSNSRQGNLDLYRKIYRSLNPGGAILVRDFFMDPTHTHPVEGAIFAVNMLAATEGGTTYTLEETKQDLERAEFSDVRLIRDGERMDQLVLAVK